MNLSLALAAVSIIFCFLFFLYFRWYIKRKVSVKELLSEYRTEVHKLAAEIDTATDRDAQLVEERIRTLRSVLEETDKRIAIYLRDLERNDPRKSLYTNLRQSPRPPVAPGASSLSAAQSGSATATPSAAQSITVAAELLPGNMPLAENILAVNAPEENQQTKVQSTAQDRENKTSADRSAKTKNDEKPELRIQIAELAAKGNSPRQIASKLKISLAEVDLALNLIKR